MLRFKSADGRASGIEILDEDGKSVGSKVAVKYGGLIRLGNIDEGITAHIELWVHTDIVAEKTIWMTKHPITGDPGAEIASFTFRDGTTVRFADDGTPVLETPR